MKVFDDDGLNSYFLNIILSFIFLILIKLLWQTTNVLEIQTFESIPNLAVRRSSSIISNASTSTNSTIEENLNLEDIQNITQNILTEASETYNNSLTSSASSTSDDLQSLSATDGLQNNDDIDDENIPEEERIIREMDRDMSSPISRSSSLRRLNRSNVNATSESVNASENDQTNKKEDKIIIKLMYLNDDIKSVECNLSESLGAFKKRNFKVELETSIVKLIFNGKLQEDDKKSLSQCGFFSGAVVHCLMMQKKNPPTSNALPIQNATASQARQSPSNTFVNYVNFLLSWEAVGILLATVVLLFCWYARINYAAYFSWYSTIGLIIMTSLFLFMIPLFSMVFS